MDRAGAGIAGIVLAGGASSRMGTNKALLEYKGRPMAEHMLDLLRATGCREVHISGDVPGYDGIPDAASHSGPARAMMDLLDRFKSRHEKLLFAPVDMPLIQIKALRELMRQNGSAYYYEHFLPCCVATGIPSGEFRSVRELLSAAGATALELKGEWSDCMANANTKEEWERITA